MPSEWARSYEACFATASTTTDGWQPMGGCAVKRTQRPSSRSFAASTRQPKPDARSINGLMHVLVHGQDICRPLGIKRNLPESHLIPVANSVKTDVYRFGTKKRIAGLKLTASDMDWTHGNGPEVTGPAEALVMRMAGRLVALDDLSGEGKELLIARV